MAGCLLCGHYYLDVCCHPEMSNRHEQLTPIQIIRNKPKQCPLRKNKKKGGDVRGKR